MTGKPVLQPSTVQSAAYDMTIEGPQLEPKAEHWPDYYHRHKVQNVLCEALLYIATGYIQYIMPDHLC